MNCNNRKQWKQPHFIVLIRNKPQERVLYVCKTLGMFVDVALGFGQCQDTDCEPACADLAAS